ncbi:MAG: type II toxin-antitoxin system RelE/ParE family toxin, partial [Planctomycetales bacterium]|nr:type II toxin-antitoxin system RelE/ParE family toxin [Planctomycetales bacterium]NIM10245.1 type II toxin-antitoxin system RelE/ParE family toxin [Planctomycetales bacterium]NIN78776.1 type II toxin-antitoxin system RelE/ParE family toxin [Planctomycetales bacterium]NIO35954.1 type II toxin-antitoxin system RelE/ParE family toxin [Planctomycetales bacterium]NIP71316.1 type II toxin-antitoxin system RelE/ParE family toxin [Planctomycetales bacterium]
MASVYYSTLATADLYENAEYIARDKPDAAYRWIETVESTCEILANN